MDDENSCKNVSLSSVLLLYRFKSDPDRLMKACFTTAPVTLSCLREYMKIVYRLGYEDQPNYDQLKGLFHAELSSRGLKDDGIGLDWLTSKKVSVCFRLLLCQV